MKVSRTITVVSLLIGVSACTPSMEEFNRADFGAWPSYQQAKDIVDRWLERTLIDPDSRKVEFTGYPQRYFWLLSNPKYAFLVCGTVNAKNRMGGYVGREPFYALIRDGVVIDGSIATPDHHYFGPPPCNTG